MGIKRNRPIKSRKGVSDVVANILILGITVTLFSSVFYFVGELPTPSGQFYVDLQPTFSNTGYNATGHTYNYSLTLAHMGGETIYDWKSKLEIAGSGTNAAGNQVYFNLRLKIGQSIPSVGDRLNTGKTWGYYFYVPTTPQSTVISVYFVDTDKGDVFWERTIPIGQLSGPYIIDRGVLTSDTLGNWNTAPYISNGQYFKVYVKLFDPLNRVANITVDMSPFPPMGVQSMGYSIFGDRYQTINTLQITGLIVNTTRDVTITIKDTLGGTQTTTLKINVLTATQTNDYIDLGQFCNIVPGPGGTNISTGSEIVFSNSKPLTGENVLITASIRNIGTIAARNATVTFNDGPKTIGSMSISVPGLGKVDAVIQATFNAPGTHTIFVNVTNVNPKDKNPDITLGVTPGFRNLYVRQTIKVYVYYDDLEGSLVKWTHEATITRINGEGPLEFDNSSSNVDIGSSWDTSMSNLNAGNWTRTTGDYVSYPSSYTMTEYASPSSRPIDVTLMLDNSGSMAGAKWTNLMAAAKAFISTLSSIDRCAIYSFQGGSYPPLPTPVQVAPFTVTDFAGRASLNTSLSGLSANQNTPLWDSIGTALTYTNTNHRASALPVVIAMTDGDDCYVSAGPTDNWEKASIHYCPGAQPGGPASTWATPLGCIWGTSHTYASIQRYQPPAPLTLNTITFGGGTTRQGLIDSPVLTYTIGCAPDPQGSSPTDPDYVNPAVAQYKYTTEYDLQQIAVTTSLSGLTGQYYYYRSPAQIIGIFNNISQLLNNWSVGKKNIVNPTHIDSINNQNSNDNIIPAPSPEAVYYGNKSLVTPAFSLINANTYGKATLEFDQKFNLVAGSNGGAVLVGIYNTTLAKWTWRYVNPQPTYTGNLNVSSNYMDNNHNFPKQTADQRIFWVYNGLSGGGTFTWEHVQVDLTPYIPGNSMNVFNSPVRVMFKYFYCAGGNNGGWWLDNVEVKVIRADSALPTAQTKDAWTLINVTGTNKTHSGSHAWFNSMDDGSGHKLSMDDALITTINLVDVKNATLLFYTKFDINNTVGSPPESFRIEISADNGQTWRQINNGIRSGYGVSGTAPWNAKEVDGKAYGGITQPGDPQGWVPSTSLERLNCDLSTWSGHVILLKFRVITNTLFDPWDSTTKNIKLGKPHGIYLDDIYVIGNKTQQSSVPNNQVCAAPVHGANLAGSIIVTGHILSNSDLKIDAMNAQLPLVNSANTVSSYRFIVGRARPYQYR